MRVLVTENIWDFDLETALKSVSEQRREQAQKFRHELGQRLSVVAYQLLKQGLCEEYGITDNPIFEYGEHGKPFITGRPEIHFNLSHCREAVACAVSTLPVGIDVEMVREYHESLARYTMNETELQQILSAPRPDVAFIRRWTMKESTLKLVGTGISNEIKSVIDTQKYRYTTVERQRYIYTVCAYV